jgi:hypothetical protein
LPFYISNSLQSWSNQSGVEIDVVTFCEAFIDEYRDKMLTFFAQDMGMPYHTSILEDPDKVTSITNGGWCLFIYFAFFCAL